MVARSDCDRRLCWHRAGAAGLARRAAIAKTLGIDLNHAASLLGINWPTIVITMSG
jgi:hypothetical protein